MKNLKYPHDDIINSQKMFYKTEENNKTRETKIKKFE